MDEGRREGRDGGVRRREQGGEVGWREEGNLERGNVRKDGFGFMCSHEDRKDNREVNRAGFLIKTRKHCPYLRTQLV